MKDIPLETNGIKFIKITTRKGTNLHGMFKCFCGIEFEARISNVIYGNTMSCGCKKKANPKNIKKNAEDYAKFNDRY